MLKSDADAATSKRRPQQPGHNSQVMKPDSTDRRLLVVSYHFPPDGTIGGQRWAGLSKYLARLGWEVHVITAAAPNGDQPIPNVHRHVRDRRRILNDYYKAAAGRVRQTSEDTSKPVVVTNLQRQPEQSPAIGSLRRIVGKSMGLPDHARGWVGRAAKAARELQRERSFDVVISSGPPHSAHFAGWLGTRGKDTTFWIDMRDPWSLTHEMNAPDDRIILAERWLLRRLERLVFPRAAKVIVNTNEFAVRLRKSDPDLDVLCLPNGIDLEQLPPRDMTAVECGSIACVGTLYAGRDLSMVLTAMSALVRRRPDAASKLRLDVAGLMQPSHREKLEREIAAAGLTSLVRIHGVLPRSRAFELLNRSHLALVLAQDQPMCVPGKLYECVGLTVPTLIIAEKTAAATAEGRRIGAMTLEANDVDGMQALLDDMISGRVPPSIKPRAPVSYADLAVRLDSLLRNAGES